MASPLSSFVIDWGKVNQKILAQMHEIIPRGISVRETFRMQRVFEVRASFFPIECRWIYPASIYERRTYKPWLWYKLDKSAPQYTIHLNRLWPFDSWPASASHELGHGILFTLGIMSLSIDIEENLCDAFASQWLELENNRTELTELIEPLRLGQLKLDLQAA